ncbi:hypothetical protein INR49_014904, partial [Caranx melampygus]
MQLVKAASSSGLKSSLGTHLNQQGDELWSLTTSFAQRLTNVNTMSAHSEEFTCAQGACVPEYRVCDFTDNCGDGSDEENCSRYKRCNFEEGFCDLTQSSETLSKWRRTSEVPGLKHDHSNNTSAYFLSLLPVGGNRTTAELITPVFQPSNTCQLSFYYYAGTTRGELLVLVQTPLGQHTELWKDSTKTQTGMWQQKVIQFSSNHSFQV